MTEATPETYSMEEIDSLIAGIGQPVQEAPAEEVLEEEQAEEHEEGEDGQDTDPMYAAAEEEEEPEVAPEPEVKRKKYVRREERDRIAAERDDARARLALEAEKYNKLAAIVEKLMSPQAAAPEAEEEDDDVVDEKAYKKVNQRIDEVKAETQAQAYNLAVRTELNGYGAQAKDVIEAVEYLKAVEVIEAAINDGVDYTRMTQAQAEKYLEAVTQKVDQWGFEMYKKGKSPLAAALQKATARGYVPASARGGKTENKGAGVNMDNVRKARTEAGAPQHKREAVKIHGADWSESIAAEAKAKGHSDAYLRKMGVI